MAEVVTSRKKKSNPLIDVYSKTYNPVPSEDAYYRPFCAIADWAKQQDVTVEKVLYPGSFIHVVPSLVFPSVVYIDSMLGKKNFVPNFFSEENRLHLNALLSVGEKYCSDVGASITFYSEDFTKPGGLVSKAAPSSFDLLISLSASGSIPELCYPLLRDGGLLVVNDDFGDGCLAKAMSDKFSFIGAVEEDDNGVSTLTTSAQDLLDHGHFVSKKSHVPLGTDELQKNCGLSFSKRPFKSKKYAIVYLFQKTSTT